MVCILLAKEIKINRAHIFLKITFLVCQLRVNLRRYDVHLGPSSNGCGEDKYRCQYYDIDNTTIATCIPSEWICDGEIDCLDALDEEACDGKRLAIYHNNRKWI